jgi:hypothetical protein
MQYTPPHDRGDDWDRAFLSGKDLSIADIAVHAYSHRAGDSEYRLRIIRRSAPGVATCEMPLAPGRLRFLMGHQCLVLPVQSLIGYLTSK